MKKEELMPLYSELQGYLLQVPAAETTHDTIFDNSVWEQYNECVSLLTKISGKDYSRFLIKPTCSEDTGSFIGLVTYRQKLGGLISRLHGEYFGDEPAPFSGGPDTIITQSQQQNQSVNVQMLLEIQSKIDEKIANYDEGSKEKSFLQKLKGSLSSISNITQLIRLLFAAAKECGLTTDDVSKLFG